MSWLSGWWRALLAPARITVPRRREDRTLLSVEQLESRLSPAVITVLTNADNTGVFTPGANPTDTTLRGAIASANPGDTIDFSPSLAGQTITLTDGELAIGKDLTIVGPGATQLTVSGNYASRVFDIANPAANVTIAGLTIANGLALSGGGINNLGSLYLVDCAVVNNTAQGDSGNLLGGGFGGGIYSAGTLFLANSTLSGNQAIGGNGQSRNDQFSYYYGYKEPTPDSGGGGGGGAGLGGGLYLAKGTATLVNSTLSGNLALGGQGGTGGGNGFYFAGGNGGGAGGAGGHEAIYSFLYAYGVKGGDGGFGGGGGGGSGSSSANFNLEHFGAQGGNGGTGGLGGGGGGGGADQFGGTGGLGGSGGVGLFGGQGGLAQFSFAGGGGGGAGLGGGVFNDGAQLTIVGGSVIDNTAQGGLGGFGSFGFGDGESGRASGGGIFTNTAGTDIVIGSTIANNTIVNFPDNPTPVDQDPNEGSTLSTLGSGISTSALTAAELQAVELSNLMAAPLASSQTVTFTVQTSNGSITATVNAAPGQTGNNIVTQVAQYGYNPVGVDPTQGTNETADSFTDLFLGGATSSDQATVVFHYSGDGTPQLKFFDQGTNSWVVVQDVVVDPANHTITWTADSSSTVPINALTGTVFTVTVSAPQTPATVGVFPPLVSTESMPAVSTSFVNSSSLTLTLTPLQQGQITTSQATNTGGGDGGSSSDSDIQALWDYFNDLWQSLMLGLAPPPSARGDLDVPAGREPAGASNGATGMDGGAAGTGGEAPKPQSRGNDARDAFFATVLSTAEVPGMVPGFTAPMEPAPVTTEEEGYRSSALLGLPCLALMLEEIDLHRAASASNRCTLQDTGPVEAPGCQGRRRGMLRCPRRRLGDGGS